MPALTRIGQLESDAFGHVAKGISKQSFEGQTSFLLDAYCNMKEVKNTWRGEWFNKKLLGLNDFKNYRPVQKRQQKMFN